MASSSTVPTQDEKLCLGTRIISVTKNGRLYNEASILVHLNYDDSTNDSIEVHLCTGHASYEGNIPLSALDIVFPKIESNDSLSIHRLTRLFLGLEKGAGSTVVSKNDPVHSLEVSFEYIDVSAGNEKEEMATEFNHNEKDEQIVIFIRQSLDVGSMKRIIYQASLSSFHTTTDKDDNEDNISVLQYCQLTGEALNDSIQQVEKLQHRLHYWKDTAEKLSNLEQTSKDTLVANFTKLRNTLFEKHKREMEELKQAHEAEKRSWKASASTTSNGNKRTRYRRDKNDDDDGLSDLLFDSANNCSKELFEPDVAKALAERRPLSSSTEKRKSVLKPSETVDIVKLRKNQEAYKKQKLERKKQDGSSDEADGKKITATKANKRKRRMVDSSTDEEDEAVDSAPVSKKKSLDDDSTESGDEISVPRKNSMIHSESESDEGQRDQRQKKTASNERAEGNNHKTFSGKKGKDDFSDGSSTDSESAWKLPRR